MLRCGLGMFLFVVAARSFAFASAAADADPDLTRTRALVASNQEIQIAMRMSDLEAAREINAAMTGTQLAHWRRLQKEMAGRKDGRTIFDFANELKLTPQQIQVIEKTIATLNKNIEQSRQQIAKYDKEIRDLHPDLGLSELAAVPSPETLIANAKDVRLTRSQVSTVTDLAGRLNAYAQECQRRIARNEQGLRALLETEAPMERVKPFVRASAEVLTELTLATVRASISIHEALSQEQRDRWHAIEKGAGRIKALK